MCVSHTYLHVYMSHAHMHTCVHKVLYRKATVDCIGICVCLGLYTVIYMMTCEHGTKKDTLCCHANIISLDCGGEMIKRRKEKYVSNPSVLLSVARWFLMHKSVVKSFSIVFRGDEWSAIEQQQQPPPSKNFSMDGFRVSVRWRQCTIIQYILCVCGASRRSYCMFLFHSVPLSISFSPHPLTTLQ